MARHNVILFFILIYKFCRVFGVEVTCWYNQALPVEDDVWVVCHTSVWPPSAICGLCKLDVRISEQSYQLPIACTNTSTAHAVPIAFKHTEHVPCMLKCPGNTSHQCNLAVLGSDPPNPPSRPECSIEDLDEDIHCNWRRTYKPKIPTTYILHWEDYNRTINSRESDREHGVIKRTEYTKATPIKVWVTAKNVLGSAKSQEYEFNTGYITRPNTPNITHHIQPLEIFWEMDCELDFDKMCQVQYHAVDEINWTEVDDYQESFLLEDPHPFTDYQFRVRCRCGDEEEIMSNWSSVYSVRTPPAAPVGTLDVWSDCAPNSQTSFCNVFWKEMPVSQARGEVNNYIVMLKLENGTESRQVTRQWTDTGPRRSDDHGCGRLVRFPLLPGVTEVFVSANTSMGSSDPTSMAFPVQDQSTPGVNLSVAEMNKKLMVSWSVPQGFSENIKEYIIQYVPVESSPAACLYWVRVNKTQRSITLTGEFKNYTAYNVSLFSVIDNSSTFLRSAVVYTLQGVPPEVPKFHVNNISHSTVTLFWSHIPVHESKGVILRYSVGINEDTVANVSSDRNSYQMSKLQPAQQYQAWVSAVTAAGEGARTITTFSTAEKPGYVSSSLLVVVILMPLVFLLVVLSFMFHTHMITFCFGVVPDPTNSKSFKHVNFQHVWPGLHSPSDSELKISELEVVENLVPVDVSPNTDTTLEKHLLDTEPQQDQIPDGLHRKAGDIEKIDEPVNPNRRIISERDGWCKNYSEMVDTDEDEGGGDDEDEDEDWEERQCVSDYERHFMPSF